MPGNGKFTHTGFGSGSKISDELKEAEMQMKATDINGIGTLEGLEVGVFIL
jgi:ATP-dependent Lon protease